MLRLVLLVLYLIASSSPSLQTKQSSGAGLNPSPPAAPTADAGAGYDPNGAK
jgi:hypothetical protein